MDLKLKNFKVTLPYLILAIFCGLVALLALAISAGWSDTILMSLTLITWVFTMVSIFYLLGVEWKKELAEKYESPAGSPPTTDEVARYKRLGWIFLALFLFSFFLPYLLSMVFIALQVESGSWYGNGLGIVFTGSNTLFIALWLYFSYKGYHLASLARVEGTA